jgi:hypothetical protein
MKCLHTFGCPVFALQNALAAGQSIPRWNPRSCIELNLGPSPMHARNVHLGFSLSRGLVSPQFHCRFDDFFKTCKYGVSDAGIQATWQHLAGLKCTSINPALLTDERLLRGRSLNDEQTPQMSHLPTGDVSISNLEMCDKNVFLDDIDVEFPPDTEEQASKDAGLPSRDAQRVRSRAPEAGRIPISKSRRPRALGEPTQALYGAPQGAQTSKLPPQATYNAGTTTGGRIRRMTRAMADSVSQQGFYGQFNMHCMAAKAVITGQTDEDQ